MNLRSATEASMQIELTNAEAAATIVFIPLAKDAYNYAKKKSGNKFL